MKNPLWQALAYVVSRPSVAAWLIARAKKTPFSHIPSNEDPSYMERYWLFNPYPKPRQKKRWQFPISVRLHYIKRPDLDRHYHDHPWNWSSLILTGGYTDVRPQSTIFNEVSDAVYVRDLNEGDYNGMSCHGLHRIITVTPGTWTMFITGRKRKSWGFAVDGVMVHHYDYPDQQSLRGPFEDYYYAKRYATDAKYNRSRGWLFARSESVGYLRQDVADAWSQWQACAKEYRK